MKWSHGTRGDRTRWGIRAARHDLRDGVCDLPPQCAAQQSWPPTMLVTFTGDAVAGVATPLPITKATAIMSAGTWRLGTTPPARQLGQRIRSSLSKTTPASQASIRTMSLLRVHTPEASERTVLVSPLDRTSVLHPRPKEQTPEGRSDVATVSRIACAFRWPLSV